MFGFGVNRLFDDYDHVQVGGIPPHSTKRQYIPICELSHVLPQYERKDFCSTFYIYPSNSSDIGVGGVEVKYTAEFFPIDIDDDSLENAKKKTHQIIDKLNNLDIDVRDLDIYFSGSKGFHINIPAQYFGGFAPSPTLNDDFKMIYEYLEIPSDKALYKNRGLYRLPNTWNSKGNCFKIPLRIHDLDLSIDNIKDMAIDRVEIHQKDLSEILPNDNLLSMKDMISQEKPKTPKKQLNTGLKRHNRAKELMNGSIKGNRNMDCFELATILRNKGYDFKAVLNRVYEWNEKNIPREDNFLELYNTIESAFGYDRQYGDNSFRKFFWYDTYFNNLKKPLHKFVYLHIHLKCQSHESKFKGHTIKENQIVWGKESKAKELNIKESTLKYIINKFERDGMIDIEVVSSKDKNLFSIITLKYFDIKEHNHKHTHKLYEDKNIVFEP